MISSIEQKEESRGNESHVSVIKGYRSKIESELSSVCDGILKLLDTKLIGLAPSGDSKVFYLKLKGDYHRYLAELIKTGSERKEAAENILNAYKSAQTGSFKCSLFVWRMIHFPDHLKVVQTFICGAIVGSIVYVEDKQQAARLALIYFHKWEMEAALDVLTMCSCHLHDCDQLKIEVVQIKKALCRQKHFMCR